MVASISKKDKDYSRSKNIDRLYGTTNLHTGTGLVELTIQSLENMILANLEDGLKSPLKRKQRTLPPKIFDTLQNHDNSV